MRADQGAAPAAARRVGEGPILVVVESPAKARTVERLLGPGYRAIATTGHLVDLPKSRLGVDSERGFEPEYITVRGKASILKELRKAAAASWSVLLATDPDREGEAIAWNVRRILLEKMPELVVSRIVFGELTPEAARAAAGAPREPDSAAVEAQKARRVLDRLVGYGLSPVLWKKVRSGLSAGRVQSAALHMLCSRERTIEDWLPSETWRVTVALGKGRSSFSADPVQPGGETRRFADGEEAAAFSRGLSGRTLTVTALRDTETDIPPEPPFTTSTLLQAASDRLGFTARRTMQVAQQLYEGPDVEGLSAGLLTFPRTASTWVRPSAIEEARAWIAANHPAELPVAPRRFPGAEGESGLREAIRPTAVAVLPESLKGQLARDQWKLYSLVWERFVASQMNDMKARGVEVELAAGPGGAMFRASTRRIVEPGFSRVAAPSREKEPREGRRLPALKAGDVVPVAEVRVERHREAGPGRFSDSSFVRALEETGIGRPSTFAPIVSVLLDRHYAARENGQLVPTPLGRVVDEVMSEGFPELVDPGFTAGLEASLDLVGNAGADWHELVRSFHERLERDIGAAMAGIGSRRGLFDAPSEALCPLCGRQMVRRLGRNGYFLACTGFPACKGTRSVPLGPCPLCGKGEVVARRKASGRAREFYGCTRFPDCGFVSHRRPSGAACPECGRLLVEFWDRKLGAYKACVNPACGRLRDPLAGKGHGAAEAAATVREGSA